MKSKNIAFENSLACLQHPLTLLSIAILLLNDHVLKVVSPSWWTGKLSDFAGLFFFPFIVAAGLSLVLAKFNLSHQRIGRIAFGLVAVWFVLLKTLPFVNSLTAQFASLFIGASTQLILDPTDLIALTVMLPAWGLWIRPAGTTVSRKAYVSLAVGVIACLASSPALPPFEDVVALAYQSGTLYARSSETNGHYDLKSKDNGDNWEMEWGATENLEGKRTLPIRACDKIRLQTCYQIDGTDKVSISRDGGNSWEIAWEISSERREYVAHVSGGIATYDLIIVQESASQYLFVARGKNGVLRKRLPDGEWIQLGVGKAQPAPLYATDLSSVYIAIRKELIIWLGVAFLVLLIIQAAIWDKLTKEKNVKNLTKRLAHSVGVVIIFVMVEASMVFLGIGLLFAFPSFLASWSDTMWIGLYIILIGLAILSPFAWLLMETNGWISKEAPNDRARPKIVFYCALTIIGVYLFGALPWPLWALGIIERYQLALTLSVLVSGLITATGYYLIRKVK